MAKNKFIPISLPDVSGNEKKYLNECIDTGWVSSIGEFVQKFETKFAAFCRQPYGVTVNSGTAALHLALRVLDIAKEDEVIVPALTFAATANAVLYQGAIPVLADCQPDCWNIDPEEIRSLITPRTKAIIPVHLYGLPCHMERIMAIANAHNIPVIEDCAEAHGAAYAGKPVGSFGRIACYSFYGNKMITTGEGGICVTDDANLYQRMCFLRDHGMNKKKRYWHEEVGYNYRLTNLQAAIGCAQLERIQLFIDKRQWIKGKYNERLTGLSCILPEDKPPAHGVNWLYTILLPENIQEAERDRLITFLAENKIDSRPVFYPLSIMPPYSSFARPTPNAKSLSRRGVTLPSYYALTEKDIDRICGLIRQWLGKLN